MRVINDWKYLFNKNAIGGRFASFTFINISYFRTDMPDLDIDGWGIIILGIGFRL